MLVTAVVARRNSTILDPVRLYSMLNPRENHGILMERSDAANRKLLTSYIGLDPYETLRVSGGKLYSEISGRARRIPGNPFHALGARLARFKNHGMLFYPMRASGSIAGYLGYDMIRYLEELPGKPNPMEQAVFSVFKSNIWMDHVRRRAYLWVNIFHNGLISPKALSQATEELRRLQDAVKNALAKSPAEPPEISAGRVDGLRAVWGKRKFCRAVDAVKRHIRAGDVYQCVISDSFVFRLQKRPIDVYRALRRHNPSPYTFYFNTGTRRLLGASPEMLIQSYKNKVYVCPIAGTRPRGNSPAQDLRLEKELRRDPKEKAEHLMLVDLGRNDLGRISKAGTVKVTDFMQVHRFSDVMHLVSKVEGELDPKRSSWDGLAACYPAGTVTGAPKIRAMEIISKLEPRNRGLYSGAVVQADFDGNLDSCIVIRSLSIHKGVASMQAGAGIVADSVPRREYAEVLSKLKAVRRAVESAP